MEANYILHAVNQINKEKTKDTDRNDTRKKLSDFCLDVAKYILTGVVFSTIFALMENVVGLVVLAGSLIVTLMLLGISLNKTK